LDKGQQTHKNDAVPEQTEKENKESLQEDA
jgi:hypothetical protein